MARRGTAAARERDVWEETIRRFDAVRDELEESVTAAEAGAADRKEADDESR